MSAGDWLALGAYGVLAFIAGFILEAILDRWVPK